MLLHEEITGKIIKAFHTVYNTLGYGFLEKVYENALLIELSKLSLSAKTQYPITVYYDGKVIGNYFADMFVADAVIVELKAAESLNPAHEAQLVNYLKATNAEVGLLLNFGKKPSYKRKVFSQQNKNH